MNSESAPHGWRSCRPAPTERQLYLATILIEPNRWRDRDRPVARVAAWSEPAAAAGFDGLEIWENHYLLASPEDRDAIRNGPCPPRIFNTYAIPGESPERSVQPAIGAIHELSGTLREVKFNVGREPDDGVFRAVESFAGELPAGVGLLCECHADTAMETPEAAARTFARWPENIGAMIHPFTQPSASLHEWFDHLGERIRHAHLQARTDGRWAPLDPDDPGVRDGLCVLDARGFRGSASLEFTEGAGDPGAVPDVLFTQACRDLRRLRGAMAIPSNSP